MTGIVVPAWALPFIMLGLGAAGWFGRKWFERRWHHADRRIVLAEADLAEQLKLLRKLNGDLYQKWLWLSDHPDAADRARATPAANEIGTWLYEHSSYFPEPMRVMMVNLGDVTFRLATAFRASVLRDLRQVILPALWEQLRLYQRKVEKRLGLDHHT